VSHYLNLALFSAVLLAYSIVAGRQRGRPFDGPLLFIAVGVLLGPHALAWLQPDIGASSFRLLAEVTLAIVLLSDAAGTNQRVAVANRGLVIRLLAIGLPLSLILGWACAAALFPAEPWFIPALLAITLAPTDAALGKPVITNPAVPVQVRESLNLESGLNDGICVPLLIAVLALASSGAVAGDSSLAAVGLDMLEEIAIGSVIGAALAWSAATAIHAAARRGWNSPAWNHLTLPGLALLCFSVTQLAGGSGFIAAFVGGLVAGPRLGKVKHHYLEANEHYGDLCTAVVWILFGALATTTLPALADWRPWLLAAASLTLIRIIPVLAALSRSSLRGDLRLFTAWFGPRGLASVVFAILIYEALGPQSSLVLEVTTATVTLSVILHGLTAIPWCRRLQPGAGGPRHHSTSGR
jgi:NhaP-type Na+/H+ or K+/H+ antiporter